MSAGTEYKKSIKKSDHLEKYSLSAAEKKEFVRDYSSLYVVAGMAKALERFGGKLDKAVRGMDVR